MEEEKPEAIGYVQLKPSLSYSKIFLNICLNLL